MKLTCRHKYLRSPDFEVWNNAEGHDLQEKRNQNDGPIATTKGRSFSTQGSMSL